MSETKPGGNLTPNAFVAEVLEQRLRFFLAVYGDTPFLLVRLNDPTGELEAGLSAMNVSLKTGARTDGLGFHTVAQSQTGRRATRKRSSMRPPFDTDVLKQRTANASYFIIQLRKRSKDPTFVERISVGRARNQDIVLRHGSVSKSHAWFEIDRKGNLLVADAGSKNGTTVKGDLIEHRKLIGVDTGDAIRFGSVDTIVCYPETLWRMIHDE